MKEMSDASGGGKTVGLSSVSVMRDFPASFANKPVDLLPDVFTFVRTIRELFA